MHSHLFWLVPAASIAALYFAWHFFKVMVAEDEGTELMRKIASHVRDGAMAYLKQQYKTVTIFFAILTVFFAYLSYGADLQNDWVPFAFLTGGFFSALAGYFGMKTATLASARAAHAARTSLDGSLRVAFRSGAVMGLVVVGLALLDISVWFLVLNWFIEESDPLHKMTIITTTMLTFGMGASLQALFARVGGGIFTKAADVGADLVGKVEAGIPEDDPRNPAAIADNVGDNVGDVAGMGADLYESFCGSILATAALGAAAFMKHGDPSLQFKAIIAPMLIAAVGTIISIGGVYLVKAKKGASQKALLGALGLGVNASSAGVIILAPVILWMLELPNLWGIWGAMVTGLVVGTLIGKVTEYYTSDGFKPTQDVAASAKTGPATVIISGIATGMISTAVPVLAVVIGTIVAFGLGADFKMNALADGLYGVGMAAVGMLSTLGITLATDAFGPIADNAGGNAEMSGLPPEVRERTDALDSLGNTTAATGKGFAIGSAALTALVLLASYLEEVRVAIIHALPRGQYTFPNGASISTAREALDLTLGQFMQLYEVHLMNPLVLAGLFLGAMAALLFCGLTMTAVGRAAGRMVEEVRRQFKEIPGILTGEGEPDYARCVEISTKGAQREMILPSIIAVLMPAAVGLIFGVAGVFGLLAGGLSCGFLVAIFMSNAGGSWDNAKKYIEQGNLGGKGSKAHRAAIIGDTVGDPFKDTSGPSLNILIKLMTMVAIVTAGLSVTFSVF